MAKKRSLWIKEYRDTSRWPFITEENVDPELFSLWPFRANGCVHLLLWGFALLVVLSFLAALLQVGVMLGWIIP